VPVCLLFPSVIYRIMFNSDGDKASPSCHNILTMKSFKQLLAFVGFTAWYQLHMCTLRSAVKCFSLHSYKHTGNTIIDFFQLWWIPSYIQGEIIKLRQDGQKVSVHLMIKIQKYNTTWLNLTAWQTTARAIRFTLT
jgi:hypothetical protein